MSQIARVAETMEACGEQPMRRVCAWCNSSMETEQTRAPEAAAGLVTHSICDDCADNLDFQMGVTLTRYLDSLKMPIIALDEGGSIIAVNEEARRLHHDKGMDISAVWNDKIYECAHARLPEGCKKAVHCSGCAIRFITADAYKTGQSQRDIPAHFNSCSADLTEGIDILVSADRIENIVFLRITRH